MVMSCSAFGCTNRYSPESKLKSIQFHRFPLKNPELLQKWVNKMKRKNFTPTKYTFLCSEHFVPDDYQIRPGASVKLLKDNVYPKVFNGFPVHLQEKLPVKRRILQRNATDNANENYNNNPTFTLGCNNDVLFNNNKEIASNSLTTVLNSAEKSIQCDFKSPTKQVLQKKIKCLQQRLKRRDLKIKSLESLLVNIKKNVSSTDELIT